MSDPTSVVIIGVKSSAYANGPAAAKPGQAISTNATNAPAPSPRIPPMDANRQSGRIARCLPAYIRSAAGSVTTTSIRSRGTPSRAIAGNVAVTAAGVEKYANTGVVGGRRASGSAMTSCSAVVTVSPPLVVLRPLRLQVQPAQLIRAPSIHFPSTASLAIRAPSAVQQPWSRQPAARYSGSTAGCR